MNGFDDLFVKDEEKKDGNKFQKEDKPFDKDAWVEKKKQERADAYALIDEGTEAITQDCEKFRDYLNVQARFDRYSVSNAILIAHQMPEATKLADFNTWKNAGVNIKKGESAITMLEPGSEYTREDGSTGFSVNTKKVFDISQTSNAEARMTRRKPDERTALKALVSSAPCKVTLIEQKIEGDAKYSIDKNTIFITKGLSADRIFKSLSREISASKMIQRGTEGDVAFNAECSSFILCERYGFDTGDFNFDDVKRHYLGMDNKEVRKDLGDIRTIANEVSQDMSRNIEEADKARKARDNEAR